MIISINQPAYLPWLGYFHRINISDVFVFFDSVQFEKNSMVNRNKVKTSQGDVMLTVPVKLKDHLHKEIREIEIADQKWRERHWKTIEINYKKSKYWNEYSPRLKKIYEKEYKNISDLCYDQLKLFLELLNIKTKIIKSSELKNIDSKKEQLIIDMCSGLGAEIYVSGVMGKDYIDNENFHKRGIKLYYQSYKHSEYNQLWGEFKPCMSIIDLLFNEGSNSLEIIMKNNITKEGLLTKQELYE
jgi:hypothetical protein